MKKEDILKEFERSWFAPDEETTLMNWDGFIKESNTGFSALLLGLEKRSAKKNETILKKMLCPFIESFLIKAYEEGQKEASKQAEE